jgi:hypothetical protein
LKETLTGSFYIFLEHNDLHNLRGQSPMPKTDVANPRQVDAVSHQSVS